MPGIVATAALVLAGCYLGASLGTSLTFPSNGAAVLFPPYAIVTAALVRTRPRHWWIILLAASAGNFLPHRLGGASVTFVLLAELVNYFRAVLAAIGLRRLAGRLETLRELVAYLVIAVLVAPCLAALAGAGLMVWRGTHAPFWLGWQEWWLSNAVTALTLLPLLMPGVRWPKVRRLGEASLLALSLAAVGAFVFTRSSAAHEAHLYWALPFLLWAAVRFGVRTTSATLLGVTLFSIWGAIGGRGAFAGQSPIENFLELEVFLLAVSMPSLLLAVLIEQQRRTAVELTESRRQYRSVVEDQTEMICRFRPDGTCTFANRAYGETFGLTPGGAVGGSVWSRVPPGVHPSREELAAITPASPIAAHEVEVVTYAGERRWQQWRDRGLFDERGAVVEVQAVGRDVTDRKQAEDEHRELEARRSVEAVLRDADRRKDEFLAMLGHELRNPLAPIGIALELLREAPSGSPDAVWARESIARQLRHMTRLLDDLLDVSRITLGKIQLQLEQVDLGRVIANAIEAARPFIDASEHQLTVTLPKDRALIRGDSVRLTQIVANLLNNASKYTERGGHIELSVEEGEDGVSLSVRDNGIGLTADALEDIFELFSQVPAAHERAQGGLGIGLTLVRRLVELHGGTVEAHSDGPGRGSEIVIHLPASLRGAPEPLSPALPSIEGETAPLRILAVDDNVDLAEGLAMVLGMWGHTVRTAHDGVEALAVADEFAPEVVLVDLALPQINGLEVARRLRQTAERPPAVLISMSGFGAESTRRRSDEAGFQHHLVKPIDLDSLRALLQHCKRGTGRA